MADRSVKVRLGLDISDYVAKSKAAGRATADLAKSTLATASKHEQAFTHTGLALSAFGAAAAAGVGLAVKRFADFDAGMSAVQAATHESAGAMQKLRDAAIEAGARTAFSATEAASGIEELAKAGVSTSDILNGGLNGALDLAAAGALDVGSAAEIAATAMTQFKLKGDQIPHVADLLAAAAGKAQGDVSDMGMALKQAGLVASQSGLSIEETTAGLAAFASAGLLGSDAGTSFKSMLQRLTPQSTEAAKKMDEIGFSAFDAQGNFIGLAGVAEGLKTSLGGMTVEQRNATMATIFGSDAVRAAAVLYDQGAAGVDKWSDAVNDSGYAQETAATRLDNLKGDIEQFSGSVETLFIKAGSAGNNFARGTTQVATKVVNAIGSLPEPIQAVGVHLGAIGAAGGLAAGGLLLMLPKLAKAREDFLELQITAPKLARGMGLATKAFVAFAAIDLGLALAQFSQMSKIDLSNFADSIEQAAGPDTQDKIAALKDEIAQLEEQAYSGWSNFQVFGTGIHLFSQGATDAGDKADTLKDRLKALEGQVQSEQAAADQATSTSYKQATSLGLVGDAANDAGRSMDDMSDAVDRLNGALSDDEAEIAYQRTLQDLKDTLDDTNATERRYARALDTTTEAGRKTKGALIDVIEAAADHGQKVLEQTGDINKATSAFRSHDAEIRKVARSLGLNKAETDKLISSLTDLGKQKPTPKATLETKSLWDEIRRTNAGLLGVDGKRPKPKVDLDTGSVFAEIDRVNRGLLGIDRNVPVTISVRTIGMNNIPAGIRAPGRADGGPVGGSGGPRADDQLIWASTGEYVVNAAATSRHRPLIEAINAGKFADGGPIGYASGGLIPTGYGRFARDPLGPGASTNTLLGLIGNPDASDVNQAWEERARALKAVQQAIAGVRKEEGQLAAVRKKAAKEQRDLARAEADYDRVMSNKKSTDTQRRNATRKLSDAKRSLADANKATAAAAKELAAAEREETKARGTLTATTRRAVAVERDFRAGAHPRDLLYGLRKGNRADSGFQANIKKLADQGYVDLARMLWEQGDSAAAQIASGLVWSSSKSEKSSLNREAATRAKLNGWDLEDYIGPATPVAELRYSGPVASRMVQVAPSPYATAASLAASVQMPSTLVIVDADGQLVGRMRVEANGAVDTYDRNLADARAYGVTH